MIDATEALLRICRIWSISFNKCSVSICYGFVNYCICVISSLWCCYFFFISFLPVFLIELPLIIIRIQGIWLNCGFRAPWESFQFHISSLFSLQLLSERKSLALVLSLSSCWIGEMAYSELPFVEELEIGKGKRGLSLEEEVLSFAGMWVMSSTHKNMNYFLEDWGAWLRGGILEQESRIYCLALIKCN